MTAEGHDNHLTLLQRLDIALASRVAQRQHSIDLGRPEDWLSDALQQDAPEDPAWISRVLALRGFQLPREHVASVLQRREAQRQQPGRRVDQETRLIQGLADVLASIRYRAEHGQPIDGWSATELFRELTAEIPRFRGNALRRDVPWDAQVTLRYPDASEVPALLEGFCAAQRFGESEDSGFDDLHPVRQAVRLLWRFGRIAPFPDFNTVMAFTVMNAHLLAKGYPMVTPRAGDRDLLARLIAGPPPQRLIQFESRLVERVGA